MSSKFVESLRDRYPEGTRVILRSMEGESDMPIGLRGTVTFVDDIGQIHVNWDNKRTLALDPKVDRFSIEV